jgi:uncharacterized protein YebE (UPF0316 family)
LPVTFKKLHQKDFFIKKTAINAISVKNPQEMRKRSLQILMIPPEFILPLTIFIARIVETSLETIRTVYVARGHKYLAAGIGVGKIAIWLLSTGLVLTNLDNIGGIIAYIAGYGIGTVIGMEIEDRISLGDVIVRIISAKDPGPLMSRLSGMGYGITRLEGSGAFSSSVAVLLMVVPRKALDRLVSLLRTDYPDLLFTIEDIRSMKDDAQIFYRKEKKGIWRFFGQ